MLYDTCIYNINTGIISDKALLFIAETFIVVTVPPLLVAISETKFPL